VAPGWPTQQPSSAQTLPAQQRAPGIPHETPSPGTLASAPGTGRSPAAEASPAGPSAPPGSPPHAVDQIESDASASATAVAAAWFRRECVMDFDDYRAAADPAQARAPSDVQDDRAVARQQLARASCPTPQNGPRRERDLF
jgi:hypothetical protein